MLCDGCHRPFHGACCAYRGIGLGGRPARVPQPQGDGGEGPYVAGRAEDGSWNHSGVGAAWPGGRHVMGWLFAVMLRFAVPRCCALRAGGTTDKCTQVACSFLGPLPPHCPHTPCWLAGPYPGGWPAVSEGGSGSCAVPFVDVAVALSGPFAVFP